MIEDLKAIDTTPGKWLALPLETKKKLSPYVVNMWRYGASNIDSIILTNESLNSYLFSVKSRKMQEKLMAASGVPGSSYRWIPNKSDKKQNDNDIVHLLSDGTEMSPSQAKEYVETLTDQQKLDILEEFGYEVAKKK